MVWWEPPVCRLTSCAGHARGGAFIAPLKEYLTAVAGVAALTLACWLLTPLTGYAAISLIYLLGVLLAGMVLIAARSCWSPP